VDCSLQVFWLQLCVHFQCTPCILLIPSPYPAVNKELTTISKGSGLRYFKVLFQRFPGVTEENYENAHSVLLTLVPRVYLGTSRTQRRRFNRLVIVLARLK
jgi:hypothetical protein